MNIMKNMRRALILALATVFWSFPSFGEWDAVKNFAKGTVSGSGYNAAAVSIVLSTSTSKFPDPPFNLVWWNATDYPDPSDDPKVEIVRVSAIIGSTLTVTRAQEGTSATTKNTPRKVYKVIQALTAKMWNGDIPDAIAAARVDDVVGPSSATADEFALFNGTTGKIIKGAAGVLVLQDGTNLVALGTFYAYGFATTSTNPGAIRLRGPAAGQTITVTNVAGAVVMDTELALTSGHVASLRNATTNVFSVEVHGAAELTPMTKAVRGTIAAGAGMTVYQSDNTPGLRVYNGTHWVKFTESNDD